MSRGRGHTTRYANSLAIALDEGHALASQSVMTLAEAGATVSITGKRKNSAVRHEHVFPRMTIFTRRVGAARQAALFFDTRKHYLALR